MITRETVLEAIKTVEDPDVGFGLVELGLIYDVAVKENNDVDITMTLTSPTCPVAPYLIEQIKNEARKLEGIGEIEVELVWDPPWNPAEMASDSVKDELGIW